MGLDDEEEFARALGALGLNASTAKRPGGGSGDRGDLSIDVDGRVFTIELKSYALVDVPRALHVEAVHRPEHSSQYAKNHILVIVGDRIVKGAREVLQRAGVSWFDRRGHVFLRGSGLRIDAPVPGADYRSSRRKPGNVKLATAVDLLLHVATPMSIRGTARRIDAAPSSVSVAARSLREDGVLEPSGLIDAPGLFWVAADLWNPTWTPVERYPHPDSAMRNPALHLGFRDPEAPGWALGGDLAAVHLGAPMGLPFGAAPDLFVPTDRVHRLAVSILGRGPKEKPAARIAVPPVSAACEQRIDVAADLDEIWLVARPLFVALDLAQDPGRGREVLEAWDPSPWGQRVW